jgi:hypothetical protein
MGPTRYRYLRQGLTLTGLGSATFDDAVSSAQEIYEIFQRHFSEGQLEGWHPSKHGRHLALDTSNRYFTPKRDAPNMEHLPFDDLVDPRGILEEMVKSGYVHGEENVVQYFIRDTDDQGVHR